MASARGIAATLQLAIQHEQDLVLSVGTFVVLDPRASQSTFQAWITSSRVFQRYPEVIGIAELALVPRPNSRGFVARAAADPPGPLGGQWHVPGVAAGEPALLPPGHRGGIVDLSRPPPAGFDYCDSELGAAFLKARDSGVAVYLPYRSGTTSVLVLGTPLYAGGVVPTSVAARRAAFIGWSGTSIVPGVVLAPALAGHPATAVAFHYRSNGYSAHVPVGYGPRPFPVDDDQPAERVDRRGDRCRRRGGCPRQRRRTGRPGARHRILPADRRSSCPCWRPAGPVPSRWCGRGPLSSVAVRRSSAIRPSTIR